LHRGSVTCLDENPTDVIGKPRRCKGGKWMSVKIEIKKRWWVTRSFQKIGVFLFMHMKKGGHVVTKR